MSSGIYAAVSGIRANQTQLNVVSNNIANINTIAFKKSAVNFKTLFSQTVSAGTRPSTSAGGTNPKQIGNGTGIGEITQNFAQGGELFTGRSSDFLIQGEGFFTVDRSDIDFGNGQQGFYFTRAGNFGLDANNNLVTANGNHVLGTSVVDGNDTTKIANINIPKNLMIWKEKDANATVLQTWIGDSTSTPPTASLGGVVDPAGESVELLNFSVGPDAAITGTYSNGDRISVRTDPTSPNSREVLHQVSDGNATTGTDFAVSGSGVAGTVTVLQNSGGTDVIVPQQLQLRLVTVNNPAGLISTGGNNFDIGPNAGTVHFGIGSSKGRGQVSGGALESSNVDIASEFTNMIIAQRGLEASSKVVSTQSEVMRTIIGIL